MSKSDKLMDAKEAARFLRINWKTVYKWAMQGRFDGKEGRLLLIRHGYSLRFKRTDIKGEK